MKVRPDWLELTSEETVEPERPIVDPHHHFFVDMGLEIFGDYGLADLWADTGSGHRVQSTVFIECGVGYRRDAAEGLAPVGETEFVAPIAAESARGGPDRARVGAIVGHADLLRGAAAREALEAHLAASDLFRGIRHSAAWDASDELHKAGGATDADLYADPAFREGFAQLAPLGLSFDAYNYHTQVLALARLARAFPETTIVLDHLGCPVGVGPYAGRRAEIFEAWKRDVSEIAGCPNVRMKLGGMAMPWNGFGFEERDRPPTSGELVEAQRDWYLHAIEAFGPERCMFESNFPVDKLAVSYPVLWNFFKKLVADFSEDEKDAMLRGTAARTYRIESA